MVDFFTVPPVFVSVYLNRSWLGKSVYLSDVLFFFSPCRLDNLHFIYPFFHLTVQLHLFLLLFSIFHLPSTLAHSTPLLPFFHLFFALYLHGTPPFIIPYLLLGLPVPPLSPHYWECVSEALLLRAAVNFSSSLKVTGLSSSDVSGSSDTAEWMG